MFNTVFGCSDFSTNNKIPSNSNNTDLTRRMYPRHPEPPYSPMLPKSRYNFSFSWFRQRGDPRRDGRGEELGGGERWSRERGGVSREKLPANFEDLQTFAFHVPKSYRN